MLKTVFFGTPEYAVPTLEALVKDLRFDVIQVVSQPDRPAGRKMRLTPSIIKAKAMALDIPVITPEKCSTSEFLDFFKSLNADVAVVVAFGQILPQKLLDVLPNKFVNLHGSLLPRWRGAAPIQRAVMSGDIQTGVSLQVMVKKLDAGDVISEVKTEIGKNETALELHDRLSYLGADLVINTLYEYVNGQIKPKAQNPELVTYAHKIEKTESLVNWGLSAKQIHQNIRGLTMGPGSYTLFQQQKLKLHQTLVLDEDSAFKPGQISQIDKDSFAVQTANGQLQILEVQPESKPKMPVKAFLSGRQLSPGDVLT